MKILITGDIHCGYPKRLKDTIWAIDIMNSYALKHGIQNVIVCGDLFHDRASLGVDVLNAVYDQLKKNKESGVKWWAFPGNHDQFLKNSWACNSIHSLEGVINIKEDISQISLGSLNFWIIPFVHYEKEYMKILKEVEEKAGEDDVLLTHTGVLGATLNECFLLKNWQIVTFEKSKFRQVFAGHFHCHQNVNVVTYPGSPISFRFDEGLVDHGFLVFDTDYYTTGSNFKEFVKIYDICKEFSSYQPPDFLTITDTDLAKSLDAATGNHVRIFLTKAYTLNELATIRTALQVKRKALSVCWTKAKDSEDESVIQNQLASVETPEATFDSWLELDKPEGYDIPLLKLLFNRIKVKAEERLVLEEEEDA